MLTGILERDDIRLVPDLRYEKPNALFLTELDDRSWKMFKERRNLFIWSTKFSATPPAFLQIDGGPETGKYLIDETGGGPSLRLVFPACYREKGKVNLASGMLSYQVQTRNPATDKWEKATPELKQGFKEILAIVKKHLVRCKTYPDIWIGQDGEHLHEMNQAIIHGFYEERRVPPEKYS
jgi:hypothetical protein